MSMSRCPADTFLAYTYGEFTLFCPMCLYQRGLDKRHKRLSVSTAPQTTSSKMSIQLNEHLSEAVSTKADIWHRKCNTPGHFSPVTMFHILTNTDSIMAVQAAYDIYCSRFEAKKLIFIW